MFDGPYMPCVSDEEPSDKEHATVITLIKLIGIRFKLDA